MSFGRNSLKPKDNRIAFFVSIMADESKLNPSVWQGLLLDGFDSLFSY